MLYLNVLHNPYLMTILMLIYIFHQIQVHIDCYLDY